jgi:DNA polymerase alpha subunit A
MIARADRLAQLRALRAAGKTGFDAYEVAEAESIYETVDDEGYKKVVRSRLDQDDFVVDDNGEGYLDDGREDWQDERQASDSESGEDLPKNSKAGTSYITVRTVHSLTELQLSGNEKKMPTGKRS